MGQRQNNKSQETEESGTKQLTEQQKKWIKGGIFFAIVIGLFIVNNIDGGPENGPYPPNYLQNSGPTLRLSDYTGKVVILDFWATYCAPCRKAIPDLVELRKELAGKNVEVIGISLDDPKSKITVESFINEFKVTYPVVMGNQSVVYKYGNISNIPTSFVIDTDGNVVSQHVGYVEKNVYMDEINKILSGNMAKKEMVKAPDFELPLVNDINS